MVGDNSLRHHGYRCLPTGLGSSWSKQNFGEGTYPYIVTSSVLTYWLVVSIIPVYNKYFFDKTMFPYPIATAGIQLGTVAILLIVINTVQHFWSISECVVCGKLTQSTEGTHKNTCLNGTAYNGGTIQSQPQQEEVQAQSWVFGSHFLWKIAWCAPIGIIFGLKYAVTNLGLHLVPAPTHLLLQSTDMVWTLLWAWIINKEHVTNIGLCCVVGCVAGSAVLSIRVGQTVSAPILAIGINLLSPILLGLCITTLRKACTELMCKENRVRGTVSSFELSALKLMLSAPVAFCLACMIEREKEVNGMIVPSWQQAFVALPQSTKLGVIGGAIFILIFQVNCTFLAFLTSAVDVGLVGQVKIIPQWIAASLFFDRSSLNITGLNEIGAFMTMTSAAVFVIYDWLSYKYPDIYIGSSFVEEDNDTLITCGGGKKQSLAHNACVERGLLQEQQRRENYSSLMEE